MPDLGDVLRGMGSALNPAVAQQVSQEQQAQQAQQNQVGMMMLHQKLLEQTPEYQAKLEAIQNEKAYRQKVAALGPNATYDELAKIAEQHSKPEVAMGYIKAKEDRLARVQSAKDALEIRKQQLEQAHEITFNRLTDAAERKSETERHNRAMEVLHSQIAQGNLEIKKLNAKSGQEKDLVTRTQKLGGALEKAGLTVADTVLKQTEDALGKEPEKAKKLATYISGENSWKPDLTVDQDVRDARQAVNKLFNITLKDRSGSAVTNQELERLKQEFATGLWKRPEQLLNGMKKAREIINQHYAAVASGFGKDALGAYNENMRGFGGRVVLEGGKQETDPLGIR